MISKTQTSISKFEEFFAISYKDDVFEILEQYPDKRSLIVDYPTLEIYKIYFFILRATFPFHV